MIKDFIVSVALVLLTVGAANGQRQVLDVTAAERHHVDRRHPQVGRHAHLRHSDEMALEHGIVHVAARQHVGHCVTDQLADAQRALRGAGL